jgi:hypothetical protein
LNLVGDVRKLQGRKIVDARYMTQKEADQMGWYSRPLVLILDDGNLLYPSADDEGNDGGALFTNDKDNNGFPVL